ncbi:MAG: hypothetical protein VW419_07875, partial [Paracoccaceae bacterium]
MQFKKSTEVLCSFIVNILVMSVCYFTLPQTARAEVSIIGSSGSTIKIEKIAVFDEPWALTFINENDLLVSTKKGKLWLVK